MDYALELRATNELSHWELSHIINVLGNTYMKFTMLDEMQKLYNNGAEDKDFIIGVESLGLHLNIRELNTLITLPEEFEYTLLDRKSENADLFWETFNKLHRPIILHKTSDGYKSLYNYENYLVFNDISTNSPQWLKTLGKTASIGLGVLIFETISGHLIEDFVFQDDDSAKLVQQNNKIIHQNEMILHNQELILSEQPSDCTEIDLSKKETKQIIKNMQDYTKENTLEYFDFIKRERDSVDEKLKRQLEKTPLKVENIFTV